MSTADEIKNCETMKEVIMALVRQMGGEVVKTAKSIATHWVFYTKQPGVSAPSLIKLVHFTYITECFFAVGRRDETKWLIKP